MIILSIIWIALLPVFYLIGGSLLDKFEADVFSQTEDRLFVAVWLGIVVLASSLLATSLVLPIHPLIAMAVVICLTALLIKPKHIRRELTSLKALCTRKRLAIASFLITATAIVSTYNISWFDTGLYHLQIISWLSEFGAVPGLALIHSRFGFTSSWFALLAPLNSGFLENRGAVIANGFILFLICAQVMISITRMLKKKGSFRDYFLVFYFVLCSIYMAKWKMPVSASPDFPIVILIGLTAWILILLESFNKKTFEREIFEKYIENSKLNNAYIIPVFLSLGALLIKLTAIPILLISIYTYLKRNYLKKSKLNISSLAILSGVVCVLLSPLFLVNILVSGCPLYPLSIFCIEAPWYVNADVASSIGQSWTRVHKYDEIGSSFLWLLHWGQAEKLGAVLLILSILTLVYFLFVRKQNWSDSSTLIILGSLGLAFIMFKSPSTRLGLGYFCILPALLIADLYRSSRILSIRYENSILSKLINALKLTFCLVIGSSFIFLVTQPSPFYVKSADYPNPIFLRIFMPPKVKSPQLVERQSNDVLYLSPVGKKSQCWSADLPCTPEKIENVKLRNPKLGLAGGFIHD